MKKAFFVNENFYVRETKAAFEIYISGFDEQYIFAYWYLKNENVQFQLYDFHC